MNLPPEAGRGRRLPPLLIMLAGAAVSGCQPQNQALPGTAASAAVPTLIDIGNRRIDALVTCYKVIILAQQRYSGTGATHDGIAGTLEGPRRTIEDRLIGNLTDTTEKIRVNERIEAALQSLLRQHPYTANELLLNTANKCAELNKRNAWAAMP